VKILFFISTLENDGAERAMSNITTHLPDNVEADILLNSVSEHDFPTNANIISLGMKPDSSKGIGYQLIALIKRIPTLYRLKRDNHYDACISFMDSANMCNILTGNKYCKTIISVRVSVSQDKSLLYRFAVKPMVRILYNKADYVTAVAEGINKELIDVFGIQPKRVKTITNGYDLSIIRNLAHEDIDINIPDFDKKFVYVTVGRYAEQKAQWHLIRAFSNIANKCDNAILLIIGQGEEKEYLENLKKENHMENRIYLLPYQKNPFSVLDKCDVFVMPSLFEGYCNALCEALICGLPCIATDFQSSAREILAPDTPYDYRITDGIEYAEYGILTPVCSGIRYKGSEPIERQEECLSLAMLSLYEDRDMLENYRNKADIRAVQLDIEKKVHEWIELAEN
jgi:glycosyltransferase involved in cell wall biosynthesis